MESSRIKNYETSINPSVFPEAKPLPDSWVTSWNKQAMPCIFLTFLMPFIAFCLTEVWQISTISTFSQEAIKFQCEVITAKLVSMDQCLTHGVRILYFLAFRLGYNKLRRTMRMGMSLHQINQWHAIDIHCSDSWWPFVREISAIDNLSFYNTSAGTVVSTQNSIRLQKNTKQLYNILCKLLKILLWQCGGCYYF